MADPWANDPVVRARQDDPRRSERQKAEARYRKATGDTNPLAQPVILPGEEGYAGVGEYIPQADVVVRRPDPWDGDIAVSELTPSQLAAEDEARRIILESDGVVQGSGLQFYQGFGLGFADEAAGELNRLKQMGVNAYRTTTGQPIEIQSGDLRNALVNQIRAEDEAFMRANPIESLALRFGGGLVTGGAGAARAGLASAVGVGAAYGAGTGLGESEGSFAQRLPGAAVGGLVGGVTGGVAQRVLPAIGGSVQGGASRVRSLFSNGRVRPSESRGITPEMAAATRLAPAVTPEALAERARLQGLGLNPSAVDVLGGTAERQVRMAAAPAGPGAEQAVSLASQRAANLRPEVMSVTRGLSDDPRSAEAVRESLLETRGRLAEEQYAPAYERPVEVTPDLLNALSDEPGRAALRRARAAAVARQNLDQVAEIDSLLAGQSTPVSAGTIDRVRIAMRGRAQAMQQRPDTRDIAGGLFQRENQIDAALENVPELAPARETYRTLSGAADVIQNRPDIFSTDPQDYRAWVASLTPEQQQAAIIGVRQDIIDTLGRQRQAGTGSLDQITQAPYSRENLAALLGPEEAARYLDSVAARVHGVQRAARISPNTNSQTFGRALDEETMRVADAVGAGADVLQGLRGDVTAIARTIDRVRARATLSPEERNAIVQLGLGSADDLERIVMLAEQARAARRPPPREVLAWVTNVRNTLGARNPVAVEIERLLLPSPVTAQDQQTEQQQ